jgi:hypothetical protein
MRGVSRFPSIMLIARYERAVKIAVGKEMKSAMVMAGIAPSQAPM